MADEETTTKSTTTLRARAEATLRAELPDTAPPEWKRVVYELQVHEVELRMQNDELRRTQVDLQESRDRYRELYELAPVGHLTLDRGTRIREANPAVARLLGVPCRRLIGRPLVDFMQQSDADAFQLHLRVAFELRTRQTCLLALDVPSEHDPGVRRSVPVRIDSIVPPGGEECRSVIIDRTALEATEKELRASEARFREIAEHLADGVLLSGREPLRIAYANPAVATIFGRPLAAIIENVERWIEWAHPEDRHRVEHAYARFERGDTFDEQYRIVRPDGEVRWVHARIFPLPSEAASVRRDLTLVQDVTTARQREEVLRQSQKMEAVGSLASGAAHDFNNVLQAVIGCINVAVREETEPARAKEYLGHAIEAARRGRDLADRLMAFARRRDAAPVPIELDRVISMIVPLVERLVTEQITVRIVAGAPGDAILADPSQIEQILMNLASNARDAMPYGGTLTIRTESIVADAEHAGSHGVEVGSRWVRLVVADTGAGMDAPTRARIFEPFFTTKDVGKGTGLGLATVFAITHQLGGHLDVQSEPGRGTVFTFCFPRCEAEARAAAERVRALPRLRGKVLVVEDMPLVRATVREDLQLFGLEVSEAGTVEEARAIADEHLGELDLLLSDVLLPTMPGPRLAEALRERHPQLRVLFMTATPERAPEGAAVLRKPFDVEDLAAALERLLGPERIVGRIAAAAPQPTVQPRPASARTETAEATILLVEDDVTSRMVIGDLLETLGYRVLEAAAAAKARELIAEHAGHIDLLLTDVNLPDGSGEVLAERLHAVAPDARVVFMSGAIEPPGGSDAFVAKPIELDELLEVVSVVLARRVPAP